MGERYNERILCLKNLALAHTEPVPSSILEIIKIRSWADVFNRPKHVALIDAHHEDLIQIIGRYDGLKPFRSCGLRTCRREHGTGFLVVLKNGTETHIGKDCGVTHFGEEAFSLLHGAFKRTINMNAYRENIEAAKQEIPNWRNRIQKIRSEGDPNAEKCHRELRRWMTARFDEPTQRGLKRLAASGNGWITEDRKLDDEQRHLGGSGMYSGRSSFVTENVYLIPGIKAVSNYHRLSSKRLDGFVLELAELERLDPSTAGQNTLSRWNRKVGQIDNRIQLLSDVLADCRRFLIPSNLEGINRHRHLLRLAR